MAVAMRTNGLHHAVSLGTIEVTSKPPCSNHFDRSYDSEDENMSRRRLRHTSSTELYPRASIYSKGDIREQYCLTDRQLNSIERPRRERFFGCLSRRSGGAQQSFLGVCVGRRVPSDENLAAYAPFYKYPRYQHQYSHDDKSPDSDMDSSYFRRQPASILSTAKMNTTGGEAPTGVGNRYSWVGLSGANNENANYTNEQSSYHCPTHLGAITNAPPPQTGPATPRTKHVSFARSHTLTSFDDVNLGLRSSGRMKGARSQERLIGGKKPIIASGSIYEPASHIPPSNMQAPKGPCVGAVPTAIAMHQHPAVIHQHPHMHPAHAHGHSHQHHHGPIHIHQFVPAYSAELGPQVQVQTEQPISLLTHRNLLDDMGASVGVGVPMNVITCPSQAMAPPCPEIVVVEKKFRNAMKTQATQTEQRKDGFTQMLALSPRTLHKVKVVSQGAQTNGLQNGKKLTKSLSEMPNGKLLKHIESKQQTDDFDHEIVHRTQSEDAPRSPLEHMQSCSNINYYEPPPPLDITHHISSRRSSYLMPRPEPQQLHQNMSTETNLAYNLYVNATADFEDSYLPSAFDYESNSLPRRACSYHRENEFSSNSLPRREPLHAHDICKHITECSELMSGDSSMDFSRPLLLPPPSQYCKDDEEPEEVEHEEERDTTSPEMPSLPPVPKEVADTSRRMSMVAVMPEDNETPFRRDDVRRQSMPVFVKTEKLIDGYGPRSSFRARKKYLSRDPSEEKEIFIDFKPHISPRRSLLATRARDTFDKDDVVPQVAQAKVKESDCESCRSLAAAEAARVDSVDDEEELEEECDGIDPVYENVPSPLCKIPEIQSTEKERKRNNLRKRSVSLDEPSGGGERDDKAIVDISAPPSPCRDEMLEMVASTYPSSDSLANDLTRDHSDGIWNESQVTVLTAEQKDLSESSYNSNLLLTPSSKRKNLILQHQQRSSIDTDALDFEDPLGDHSPTYSNVPSSKVLKVPTSAQLREHKPSLTPVTKVVTPSIAVTPSSSYNPDFEITSPKRSPGTSKRSSLTYDSMKADTVAAVLQSQQPRRVDPAKYNMANATDVSECSTNTDEYATCTDTSKRTPGIKTPPTATSSSSTTQVPVSTQSSQVDKTHGGSSFESASSLYSTRGEILSEDLLQLDEQPVKFKPESDTMLRSPNMTTDMMKKSPSHSISSTSSGSYNVAALPITAHAVDAERVSATTSNTTATVTSPAVVLQNRELSKIKPESVSDDERSEMRYSSSGYYESPHDDDNITKSRRHRQDEDRKRRKTTMKLDIEKENMRALTSPLKKPTTTVAIIAKEHSPEKPTLTNVVDATSPNKIKRFRPKIRRQFRRSSRDDSTPKRQKNLVNLYGLTTAGSSEKLLDGSMTAKPEERAVEQPPCAVSPPKVQAKVITSPIATAGTTKSASEVCQLKAKSVESLRSVSPGSDSVFYSEADGTAADQHSHCLHCGKEMEGQSSVVSGPGGDSVESLPFIEHDMEQDIVKPPSDFADSPVTTKTTQRLYKKMDKRFRSEERYHGERGRHYKSRQENIRAKSEERSRDSSTRSPHTLRPAGSSPCVLPDVNAEQSQQIIYRGHYNPGRYTRLTDSDVWTQLDHQSFDRQRDRRASTDSEHSFHSKYQVILHRLVQRRCTLEMYHRQKNNTFQLISSNSSPESVRRKLEEVLKLMLLVWAREGHVLSGLTDGQVGVDKTIVVKSDSGEFGFRIHGSKPVVVAAIEPETPAESSGLEVGDIIISVNGIQVLDKHHTEVVKIAHDGCEKLELQVARTIGVLMSEQQEPASQPIYSGYLWRQSGQAKGSPNTKKWVRRWFCLRPDNCLYYYKTENDTQPVGAMIMAKHTIEHCPPEVGKPFAFKVDAGEGIPLYAAADSEEAASRWIKILKQSAVQGTPWLDNCARNLYQTPSSIIRPDCFGYLMKLGSRWCGWSKRYCVLKDACLYFYQDANSKTAFGMACLHGYKVASMSTSTSGKKNSFEIIPPESKLRHYYFCTESEMDKKRWISALEYSIDRWIKSG